ncbi:hypothetical protein Ahy_A06g027358 isoform B [Arachis hypogaea]|uniref:Epoxide hydrolase N-terminal domain-containing protein n=1 Tax=Arachis hypogaea TaxID=3818 RepID=A0A445CNE5_ARAHY|nr:hypothetical protein Ahy_A06g027358 isoform B [Arachis hypogaea]
MSINIKGKVEAEMAQVGAEYVVKNIITTRKTGPPIFPKGEYGTAFNPDMKQDLPSWLTQQDLAYFVSKFKKTGFTGGLNYYRNLNKNWELTAPWSGAKIKVSVKFITGELDMVYTSLGMKDYIESGGFKEDVPGLEEVIIQPGVAHFNNQESPLDITNHIYDFITKNWELEAPYSGVKIKVPVRFITGELDMVYTSLGLKEYIHDALRRMYQIWSI